jgi:hypothetical protein
MKKYIYQHTFKKSPGEDSEPKENIFTKKRRDQFNFDNFQFNFRNKAGKIYPSHIMCDYKKK